MPPAPPQGWKCEKCQKRSKGRKPANSRHTKQKGFAFAPNSKSRAGGEPAVLQKQTEVEATIPESGEHTPFVESKTNRVSLCVLDRNGVEILRLWILDPQT